MRVLDAVLDQYSKIDSPLQLSEGDKVLAVERVRTADDQPVIYSRDRIPARLLRDDLDLENLHPSLFGLLSSSGHAADHATATLRAVSSTSRTAKVLGYGAETSAVHRGDRLRPRRHAGHVVPGVARLRGVRRADQPAGRDHPDRPGALADLSIPSPRVTACEGSCSWRPLSSSSTRCSSRLWCRCFPVSPRSSASRRARRGRPSGSYAAGTLIAALPGGLLPARSARGGPCWSACR